MSVSRADLRLAGFVFVAAAGFYLLQTPGHISTPDGVVMFRVAKTMAENGQTHFEPLASWPQHGGQPVQTASGEIRHYSWYGLGPSLVAVPLVALGGGLHSFLSEDNRAAFEMPIDHAKRSFPGVDERILRARDVGNMGILWYDATVANSLEAMQAYVANWMNPLLVAACVAAVFLLSIALGASRGGSLVASMVVAVGSPLWPYAKDFFSEPLSALGIALAALFTVLAAGKGHGHKSWFAAGMMLGVAVLSKSLHVLLLVPFGTAAIILMRHRGRRRALVALSLFMAGLGPSLGMTALYNSLRFGSPFTTGYGEHLSMWTTPVLEGLQGLVASPGRGLLLFFPAAGASIALLPILWRKSKPMAVLVLLSLLTLVAAYSRWYQWEGGWCWGPRFLVPLVPLLAVPWAFAFEWCRRAVARIAMWAVGAVSVVVAFSGTLVNPITYYNWLQYHFAANRLSFAEEGVTHYYDLLRWWPSYSPLTRFWDFPVKDYSFLPRAIESGGALLAIYSVFAAVFLIGVAGVAVSWKKREAGGRADAVTAHAAMGGDD